MHLYYVPNTRSFRVLWTLEEVGAPYDLIFMEREGRQTPEHLARHPLGYVPVADDGEGTVYESAALCLQVADQHPEKGLAPAVGTHERGLLYQWLFYAMTEIEVPLVDVFVQKKIRDEPIEAVVAAATKRFARAVAVIDAELAGCEYMLGSGFSVADVVLGEMMGFAGAMGLLDGVPNVTAYRNRLVERPAFQRATEAGAAPAAA